MYFIIYLCCSIIQYTLFSVAKVQKVNMENKILTPYQEKAKVRFAMVTSSLEVFKLFWEIGFRSQAQIYLQLCIAFPEYANADGRNKLKLMWNFVKYDKQLIKDLYATIDKINKR